MVSKGSSGTDGRKAEDVEGTQGFEGPHELVWGAEEEVPQGEGC
jgi:hypothetical protein